MAGESSKPQAEDAKAEKAAAKSSKLPLIAGAIVLLLGGVGASWYLGLLGGRHHEEAAASQQGHETASVGEGHGSRGEAKPGAIVPLDSFIANLADESGKRYLKATFQIQFGGDGVPSAMQSRTPQVRDLLLTLLTSKTYEEIRTPEGKQQLRDEILARVNQVLESDAARAVYFTEFIVQ